MKLPTPKQIRTPKSKRLSWVAVVGAVLAVVWAGLEWIGVSPPAAFTSALATLGAMLAGSFDLE